MRRTGRSVLLLAGTAMIAAPASADTIREALAQAYITNPSLQGARAQQRATDENVAIEKSAGRPQVDANALALEATNPDAEIYD